MSEENELPNGWAWTTLGDILPIQYGKGLVETIRDRGGQVPVYGSSGVVGVHNQALTSKATLIIGRKGSIGSVHYSPVPCWPIDTTYFVEESANTDLKFFLYLLSFLKLSQLDKSTAIPGLSRSDYNPVAIKLAPLPEQQRIVAAIEQQFSRLDAGVVALRQAKEKLKRYRAAVLKAAVEGKLTEAWRAAEHPATEPASKLLERILAERRAKWGADLRVKGKDPAKVRYVEPKEPEVESLPELPEGWCWVSLETVSSIQLGKMLSPKAYEHGLLQMPYLRNENVRWGSIDYRDVKNMGFKESELERYRLEPYDLLICEGGEAGRCAVYTGASGQFLYQKALHRVRMKSEVVSPYFIQFCMQYYVASKIVIPRPSETTIQHLPLEKMQVLPFPLPPLAEQEQIASEVEQRLSIVSELEAAVEANLKRAERLRQSILKEAFAGRLVPQDPNDEPASVLLERIRGERNGRKNGKVERKAVEHVVLEEPVNIDVVGMQQAGLWEEVGR